jgi:hypothetical protein
MAPRYFRRRHPGSITGGDLVALLEEEIEQSAFLYENSRVSRDSAVIKALDRRYAQKKRHLAFLRLERRLRSADYAGALGQAARDPRWLSFLLRWSADRLRRAAFALRQRNAGGLPPLPARRVQPGPLGRGTATSHST